MRTSAPIPPANVVDYLVISDKGKEFNAIYNHWKAIFRVPLHHD
jgi:hypothetical protein